MILYPYLFIGRIEMATVVQSADGPTEVINARRTESLDAPNILKLVTKATQPQFGLVDVVNIM